MANFEAFAGTFRRAQTLKLGAVFRAPPKYVIYNMTPSNT